MFFTVSYSHYKSVLFKVDFSVLYISIYWIIAHLVIWRASKYFCMSHITRSLHLPVPRMDSLRQSAMQILESFRMYSVTICQYMHSKLDFSAAEILPRSTGNCGLAVKLNCLAGAEHDDMNGHQTVQSSGSDDVWWRWCVLHDSDQIKMWRGLHGCFFFFFWPSDMKNYMQWGKLIFWWYCVQSICFLISRTTTRDTYTQEYYKIKI